MSEYHTEVQKSPKFKIWFHNNHLGNQMLTADSQLPIEIEVWFYG